MSDIIVNLESNTLYSEPGPNYAVAATGVRGKSATVRWKEGSYYYVSSQLPAFLDIFLRMMYPLRFPAGREHLCRAIASGM